MSDSEVKGRQDKLLIEAPGTKWGLGVTDKVYTVEIFQPSVGWVAQEWHSILAYAGSSLIEHTVRAKLINELGIGVNRLTESFSSKIMKEVSDVERRLYRESVEFLRGVNVEDLL